MSDNSLELISSALSGILEKSTVFAAMTFLVSKDGKVTVNQHIPPYLSNSEKVHAGAALQFAILQIAVKNAGETMGMTGAQMAAANRATLGASNGR